VTVIYDPTGVNYMMNTLQAAKVGDRTVFSKAALDHWVYAKSMEGLREDLPSLGFQARKVG
jgi:hypothetical protein